jgi:hypothetical protein
MDTEARPNWRWSILVGVLTSLPLIIAIIVLRWRPWYPVLDMAMTEFRVRDVGSRHTPLIGLPGRIGNFPDQGSHPGPISYYLLAPFYRIGGSSPWAMQLGSVAINAVALTGIVWIWARRASWRGLAIGAVIGAVLVRGYGITVLSHPWNPYFPLIIWGLVLVAAWAVTRGDKMLAIVVVLGATIATQTHVPYLPVAVGMAAFTIGWLLVSAVRSADRSPDLRALTWSVGVGLVLWLPALVDQIRRTPGNLSMLIEHFTTPGENPISVSSSLQLFLRHLDAPGATVGLLVRSDEFVYLSQQPTQGFVDPAVIGGLITLVAFAAAVIYAWRQRLGDLLGLQAVVAVALGLGLISMTRIFGTVWYYLTLWSWSTLTLLVISIAWAAWHRWIRRSKTERFVTSAIAAIAVVITLISIGAGIGVRVPEPMLSKGLGAVVEPTIEAVAKGVGEAVGPNGSYIVFWQDAAFIGAQGYGLVNELERRGLDVGVNPTWRVPVTHQRVKYQGQADAEIHLVSGVFIDEWRERPGYAEVIVLDPRTDQQRQRFEELQAQVITELTAIGRTDLIEEVNINLFGARIDPTLPERIRLDLIEMLEIGQPVAVFIAPAGSTN